MKRIQYIIFALAAISGLCVSSMPPAHVSAASGFQSNRIIDDALFFSGPDLSSGTIQQFLNSKVPSCDTNGTQIYSGSTTRAAYGASKGYPAPYTCLKDYRQDAPSKPDEPGLCTGYAGGANKSSADILYDVSQICGVNPRVLIILLQKEQSLVTDDWPWPIQYQKATGYACPDTAPCDTQYSGFFNQVYHAARQYKRYVKDSQLFSHRVGRTSFVQYNPNGGCGGSNTFLMTNATAALYNYTPYQPNAAALSNLYGSGDGCSAYGNRNFWRMFNDWFGATTSDSDTDLLSFIRLNHGGGKVENLSYSSIGSYSYSSRGGLTSYPAVTPDGSVVPLYWPNGDLVFIRLNHGSGKMELVSYSASSGFQQLVNYRLTSYPAVTPDGSVVPRFTPQGNLSLIRLNHGSGKVEVITYSASSGFQTMIDYKLTSYPAVTPDGSVVPLYWPNGDLVFIRLNHGSGKVELVSYSATSGYQQLANYQLVPYPAVPGDGTVVPRFKPNGDLSFIRLNHSSGKVEVVSYGAGSRYQQLSDLKLTTYPAVPGDGAVIPLYTR